MQYLLSETEFQQLQKDAAKGRGLPVDKELQELCTLIADTMPITWTWGPGKDKPTPWGCIITKQRDWYCDQCPVQKICPNIAKDWSK